MPSPSYLTTSHYIRPWLPHYLLITTVTTPVLHYFTTHLDSYTPPVLLLLLPFDSWIQWLTWSITTAAIKLGIWMLATMKHFSSSKTWHVQYSYITVILFLGCTCQYTPRLFNHYPWLKMYTNLLSKCTKCELSTPNTVGDIVGNVSPSDYGKTRARVSNFASKNAWQAATTDLFQTHNAPNPDSSRGKCHYIIATPILHTLA